MSKTVLIVAYNYPPIENSGVHRPYAFSRYLSLNGYHPVVLTTNIKGEIKKEKDVYRFDAFDDSFENKKIIEKICIITVKIIRKMLFRIGFINVYAYKWYRTVLNNLTTVIERHKPDIVFATFPGYSNLAIGAMLSNNKKFYP